MSREFLATFVLPLDIDLDLFAPGSYRPEEIELEKRLIEENKGRALSSIAQKIYQGSSPKGGVKGNSGVPALKVKNLSGIGIGWELDFLDLDLYKEMPSKVHVENGDVFVIRSAHHRSYIGKSVDNYHSDAAPFESAPLVTEELIGARIKDILISSYITSFLRTNYGYRQIQRRLRGVTAKFTPRSFGTVKIPFPHQDAQAYIGNKVRQAEALRARARERSEGVNSVLSQALPGHPLKPHMWSRTPSAVLENRLDPRPYRSHRLALRDAIKEGDHTFIKDLVEIKSGNPVPSKEFIEHGVPLIKNGDIQHSGFSSPTTACVSNEYHRENIVYAAHEGTIVVCLDGEIRSQFFLPYELPAHVNQRVAILEAKAIRPELLTAWLNHPCLQEQLLQWSVQTTVEHISNSIIAGAVVPRLKDEEENKLADDFLWSRMAGWFSGRLVLAAKLLVEALIERKVTEAELIAAHNDPSADRELMQKLTVDGFDVSGAAPLFDDLERLQELLNEANSAGGSDEV